MAKDNFKRLQFDFSEDAVSRLDDLVKKTASPTRAELVRKSLRFFEYISDKLKDGYRLELSKDKDKIALPTELIL
jgi:hypothetical protein